MRELFNHTFTILAYKESPYLKDCITSLKRQTVKSKILIVTSTPSLYLDQISKEYRVPVKVNHERIDIGSDWTFAYNNAETQYVTLAHQDDIYSSEYTEWCLDAAKKVNDSLIVFTDYAEIVDRRLRTYTPNLIVKMFILLTFFTFKKSLRNSFLKKLMLSLGSPISCPSVFFNKKNVGTFKFSRYFSFNLDWDAWLRLARREGAFVYVRRRLLLHRIHRDSQTTVCTRDRWRHAEDEELFEAFWPRPISKLLSRVYLLSYISNKVGSFNGL